MMEYLSKWSEPLVKWIWDVQIERKSLKRSLTLRKYSPTYSFYLWLFWQHHRIRIWTLVYGLLGMSEFSMYKPGKISPHDVIGHSLQWSCKIHAGVSGHHFWGWNIFPPVNTTARKVVKRSAHFPFLHLVMSSAEHNVAHGQQEV